MTDIFLNIFNDYYPFERYIFITPLEHTKTMHIPEIYVKETPDGDFNKEDVLITLEYSDVSVNFDYFGLSNELKYKLAEGFRNDLGYKEFEMLYSERECKEKLGQKLTYQYTMCIAKYGECYIKKSCNKLYKLVGQEVHVL